MECFSFPVETFHLKEVLCGFSGACPNCQHHCSCALGPLWSKMRVTCTRALRSPTVDLIARQLLETNGQIVYTAGRHGTEGTGRRDLAAQNSLMRLRTVHNPKCMSCLFLTFLIESFQAAVDHG